MTIEQPPTPSPPLTPSAKRIFTPRSIHRSIIQNGSILVVLDNKVYDLSEFAKVHPGGQTVLHYVNGQDATDIVDVFHPGKRVVARMAPYYIGDFIAVEVEDRLALKVELAKAKSSNDELMISRLGLLDKKSVSPSFAKSASTSPLAIAYLQLNQELRDKGFYVHNPAFYYPRALLAVCTLLTSLSLLIYYPGVPLTTAIAAFLVGFVWHAMAFSAHDAGHHSVTGNRKIDDYIGIGISSFCGGLSISWWKLNHNVHHIVTNIPEHDPDIQHLPFIAITSRFFNNIYSTFHNRIMKFDALARLFVPVQHYLYYLILSFGRFLLYAKSYAHLLNFSDPDFKEHRWLEISGVAFFWLWYGYGLVYCCIPTWALRILFIYISHLATVLLHIQITISHFAMSTEQPTEKELFVELGVRTTMNIDCPEWMDPIHGGLQFQIEHHLFPRIPRCHFRALQPIVKQFCLDHGLDYHTHGFVRSNGIVLGILKDVAQQVEFYASSANPSKRYVGLQKKNI